MNVNLPALGDIFGAIALKMSPKAEDWHRRGRVR